MSFSFIKWIKGKFPNYFWLNDTYLDSEGNNGFFERYLTNFEGDYEEEIYPFITDVFTLLDARQVDAKYLPYLAYMMGGIPVISNTTALRKFIQWAVRLWMVKGTILSYEMIFNLFGLDVKVIEHFGRRPIKYDNTPYDLYDDDTVFYDISCPGCTDISLAYFSQLDNCQTQDYVDIDPALLDTIGSLLCLITPIDVKIKEIVRANNFCENVNISTDETTLDDGQNSCSLPSGILITDTLICTSGGYDLAVVADEEPGVLSLSWTLQEDAIGYEIQWVLMDEDWDSASYEEVDEVTNSLELSVTPGEIYIIRIRAKFDTGYCLYEYSDYTQSTSLSCALPTNILISNNIIDS